MPCLAAVKPLIVPPRPALARAACAMSAIRWRSSWPTARTIAREAAELIEIDYEPLPSVVDGRAALARWRAALWDEAPGNLAFHVQKGDADAVGAGDEGAPRTSSRST